MNPMLIFIRYLEANLLVVVGYVAVRAIQEVAERGRLRHSHLLSISRLVLVSTIGLSTFHFPIPTSSFLAASAQIWSAPTMKHLASISESSDVLTVGKAAVSGSISIERFWLFFLLLGGVGLVTLVIRWGPSGRKLRELYGTSHCLKRLGGTEVRVSEQISIPFSFWMPARALIFLPSHLVGEVSNFMIAFRHEAQHHRQRDTVWVYVLEVFRCLFFFNPFSHFWVKQISEIQEFACDETLLDLKHVSPHAYGGCLLRVAETARGAHPMLVGTTCMAASPSGIFLKRRIQFMLNEKKRYLNWSVSVVGGFFAVALVASAALASQGLVQDRRITIQEAEKLADNARKNTEFPITINESVVKQLNRYVGTPDGREFIKNTLARMENYRTLVEGKLGAYQLPRELMAMPIMESGYINSPQNPYPRYSAGIWQFIPQTARNYGMKVDGKVDERLNVEKATDAACRYLGSLQLRFKDWELSILAYNAGENKVHRGITKTGSKNAWTLIEKGFGGDEGYLPKMVAAILIMNSPSVID